MSAYHRYRPSLPANNNSNRCLRVSALAHPRVNDPNTRRPPPRPTLRTLSTSCSRSCRRPFRPHPPTAQEPFPPPPTASPLTTTPTDMWRRRHRRPCCRPCPIWAFRRRLWPPLRRILTICGPGCRARACCRCLDPAAAAELPASRRRGPKAARQPVFQVGK